MSDKIRVFRILKLNSRSFNKTDYLVHPSNKVSYLCVEVAIMLVEFMSSPSTISVRRLYQKGKERVDDPKNGSRFDRPIEGKNKILLSP